MILPKRTPWRDRAELESVFAGIYESSGDLEREAYAIERVSRAVEKESVTDCWMLDSSVGVAR